MIDVAFPFPYSILAPEYDRSESLRDSQFYVHTPYRISPQNSLPLHITMETSFSLVLAKKLVFLAVLPSFSQRDIDLTGSATSHASILLCRMQVPCTEGRLRLAAYPESRGSHARAIFCQSASCAYFVPAACEIELTRPVCVLSAEQADEWLLEQGRHFKLRDIYSFCTG